MSLSAVDTFDTTPQTSLAITLYYKKRVYTNMMLLYPKENRNIATAVSSRPLVDVRIATWLVKPDCPDVTDSPSRVTLKRGDIKRNLEGLLTLKAGKDAVTSALNVLRTVSGQYT